MKFDIRKTIIKTIMLIAMILGIHRICCLETLNTFEDYIRCRKMPVNDLRMAINKQDPAIIDEIESRVGPDEGILALDYEPYFISYYAYPRKVYKYKKGYFATSTKTEFGAVDRKWLEDRNIKWVLSGGEDKKTRLNRIEDAR